MMITVCSAYAQDRGVFFREDFNDLHNWRPIYFPKIQRHSTYTILSDDSDHCLKTESNDSASAIVCKLTYNVYQYPLLKWRWKVDNVYKKGNATTKAGDDYPLRIYVLFKYDPDKASIAQRILYEAAKLIYGEYPADSSLNYVWANKPEKEAILPSPVTNRVEMVMLEEGLNVGKWVDEDVNVLKDYKRAFGHGPPSVATIGIMNDSDNTGESSTSYLKYIEIYR